MFVGWGFILLLSDTIICLIHAQCPGTYQIPFTPVCTPPPIPFKIWTIHFPPYILADSGTHIGVFNDLLKEILRGFCTNPLPLTDTGYATTQELAQNAIENQGYLAGPVVALQGTTQYRTKNWLSIWSNVKIGFFTVDSGFWKERMDKLITSFANSWPLGLIVLFMCFYAGVIIWLLDMHTNPDDFPRTFPRGAYEGFWWSFISATTVGYGDHSPISVVGRVFAVIWILLGITLVSLFTGSLTSSITATVEPEEIVMVGLKIGVLKRSPIESFVVDLEGGTVVEADSMDHLHYLVATAQVDGIAMDINVAAYYQKDTLSKWVKWRLQKTFDTKYEYGLISTNLIQPPTWTCIDTFMQTNAQIRDEIQQDMLNGFSQHLDVRIAVPPTFEGLALFDPKSVEFQRICIGMAVGLVVIFIAGFALEMYMRKTGRGHFANNPGYHDSANAVVATATKPEEEKEKSVGKLINFGFAKKDKGGDDSVEENRVTSLVERSLAMLQTKLADTEKHIQLEIQELSRSVRKEMLLMKRNYQEKGNKDVAGLTNPTFNASP